MKYSIAVSLLLASSSFVFAASTIAIDAGNDGWSGWTEVLSNPGNPGQNGSFLGGVANGSDITTTGSFGTVSWSLYANSGQTAARVYDLGGSITVGQTLSIDMDNPGLPSGAIVGFSLQNSTGTNRFEFYYIGEDSVNSYKINDLGGQENVSPTVAFTSSGLSLSFTQLAADAYSFSINGNAILNSDLTLTASDISKVRIFNYDAGGSNDAHFNSLTIVPEPTSAALGLLGMALLLRRRRI